jgi:hemerythrin-like domain-containing protein
MEIYSVLKQDHRKVQDIINALCETTEKALQKRERLFTELKRELDIHSRLEEELFYPTLKEKEKTKKITYEAYQEHLLVENLLNEMDKLSHDAPEWTAKLSVLKENLNHHIKEEENELFPLARTVYKPEQAEEIGNTFLYKKEELLATV